MRDLGTLGPTTSAAFDINDVGQVVGRSGNSESGPVHAFIWTAKEGMRDLYHTTGLHTAAGINNRRQVVGDNLVVRLHIDAGNRAPAANTGRP